MGKQRSDGEARASRGAGTGPTYPPPQPGGLSPVLERNLGWVPVVPAWDPSFVVLAMVAAVEAIFLSTFVLVSQSRMAAAADKRANLDLQVSLLTEHEITQLVTLVSGIADRMGVKTEADADLGRSLRTSPPRRCSTSSRRRKQKPSSPDLSEGVCRHGNERGRGHPS